MEIDYKEKYEQAIERLKQWDREHPNGYAISERDEFIFPELKKSDGERIRMVHWSEEDRETIDYLIDYLESELDSSYTKEDKEEFTKEIELLKSLRPQSQWKPSENELEVLRLVAEKDGTCLMGLYENLKKLREE